MSEADMAKLASALRAWGTEHFEHVLSEEVRQLGSNALPLEQATEHGGHIDGNSLAVMFLRAWDTSACIHAKVGIFFTEIVPACCCPYEPSTRNIYCEMCVRIDKFSGEAHFKGLPTH